jgi:hypothetical protein
MFDSQCTFRVQIPALARTFPALLNAILAISARQMERKKGIQDSFDSIELYQEAIRLLSPLLQNPDPKVVAACVLLCCLEMMSARAQDWRRHLEGCTALFDAFGINGFSSGLLQAIFWCYVRMGMIAQIFNYSFICLLSLADSYRSMRCTHFRRYAEHALTTQQMVGTRLP